MSFAYLAILIVSILGISAIDYRHKAALWTHTKRTILTILIGVLFFSVWDIAGIVMGIFFAGDSPYVSGIFLLPEYPIEEFFFLTLLCYQTLVFWRLWGRRWG